MVNTISRHIFLFISASALAITMCISFFKIYEVREDSMEPLLHNGQTILVLREKSPHSGDIVVFENPEDQKLVVKRCILSPGDPVVIDNNSLITTLQKIPLNTRQLQKLSSFKFIPDDMFFAAGDNVFNSHDSRDYGPVFIKNLKGRVLLIK
ncbi:MAG: signal peptidase I [Spirochaetaceae bacterium]|nr:signal peptidase I [Spirochaetaceae bacterium]